ncbi:unnamed protein product [Peronospora destructor]|nr:unnamed protein product [Peronospora destructor]
MGNEAADADSIVSSLTYAFMHAQQHSDTLHVSVLPITRAELTLRCDVTALFEALDVDTDALVFVDEFPWDIKAKVKVTLMDHNAFSNKKIPPVDGMKVVEIVDHHSDLGQHLDAEKREVAFADGNALVASTCTLVAESPEIGESGVCKKKELFKWLEAQKFNSAHWKAFTLENCLQVDYKEFTFAKKVGISVVLVDLETFVLKSKDAAALRKRLSAYCKLNVLAFVVVVTMFMTPDGQCHRQLLFFQENGDDAKHCVAFLNREGSLLLDPLQLPETHRHEYAAAFNQLNIGASRKQIAPLIQRALAEPVVKL